MAAKPPKSTRPPVEKRQAGNTRGPERGHLKDAALAAFRESGTVGAACKRMGIDRDTFFGWLKDPEFEKRFAEAQEEITEVCESALMARGVNGVPRVVFYKGQPALRQVMAPDGKPLLGPDRKPVFEPYTFREYSDTCLIKLLEARNPAKYSTRVNGEFKLDVRIYAEVLSDILTVIRQKVPSACPHCKTVLNIQPEMAAELEKLSKKFETTKAPS